MVAERLMGQHIHIQDDVVEFQCLGNLFTTLKIFYVHCNLMALGVSEFLALNVETVFIQGRRKGFGIFYGVLCILFTEFHHFHTLKWLLFGV